MKALPNKIKAQVALGVPYPIMTNAEITDKVETQAQEIAKSIVDTGLTLPNKPDLKGDALRNYLAKSQGIAVIAYVQKLGSYKEVKKPHPAAPSALNPDSQR